MATENMQYEYERHTLKSFLEKYRVVIPKVQRDYAQGRTTDEVKRVRNRFLDAIFKNITENKVMELDFVYGEQEKIYSQSEARMIESIIVTPLDGQQRLTTLYLLHWFAAKKQNIAADDFAFLSGFTYDIRPSSRDFCRHLIGYVPDWSKSLQSQLKDQNWFMGEWNHDPTIIGMLVMLDAINEKFGGVSNILWEKLTNGSIIFYFLPLAENGLSDDQLYIKMNSRGKKLTPFEHFKAEYEDLYERDSEEARSICHKFDVEWIDTFFSYRNKEDIVDDDIMRYFFYISHILCYRQNIAKSNDEFELIGSVYKNSPANRKYLENAFDCWYRVMQKYSTIDAFFDKFLAESHHETDKVTTFKNLPEYHGNQNFFHACIKLYQVNNNFSYGDFLFLYGIITYLLNEDSIAEADFVKRLRMLRNLIWNSTSGEIRGDADYMHSLLSEVETLILKGTIDKKLQHGFNALQEDEEIEKPHNIRPENVEVLCRFEDHPLIYGFASGLGYGNLGLADTFISLFSNNPDLVKIHRALLAVGDYRQNASTRYYMGNANLSTWSQLLHRSRFRRNFDEKTMCVLRELLERVKSGNTLDEIISGYLDEKVRDGRYDWKYYFVKYPDMLKGAEGEVEWDNSNDYICTTLNKHQFNGRHWNPFLNVIYNSLAEDLKNKYRRYILNLMDYGNDLEILKPASSLIATQTGFILQRARKDENRSWEKENWDVAQDGMVDTVDRVEFAIEKLTELVRNEFGY